MLNRFSLFEAVGVFCESALLSLVRYFLLSLYSIRLVFGFTDIELNIKNPVSESLDKERNKIVDSGISSLMFFLFFLLLFAYSSSIVFSIVCGFFVALFFFSIYFGFEYICYLSPVKGDKNKRSMMDTKMYKDVIDSKNDVVKGYLETTKEHGQLISLFEIEKLYKFDYVSLKNKP